MHDCRPVRELLTHIIGGGWGSESADDVNEQQVAIIRGADFPQVQVGDATSLPIRFESSKRVGNRRLQDGDIVLEISGGTNERPTGRSVFVSQSILSQVPVPVIPASFCRLLRPDPLVVEPRYLYYWLQDMFSQGRTWAYQVRSTGIANFQTEYFLDQEIVTLPPLAEQRRIAGVLGALDDLIEVNRGLIADLNEMAAAQASRWIRSSDLKVRLSEVADHLAGKYLAKDKYAAGGQYVVHGSNSIMGTHSEFLHRGPLTVLARIGSFCGALAFSEDSAWINNNASAIRAKRSSEAYWLHRSLLSVDMDMHRAGSGQPFVRVESLMNTEIPWLSPEELESANRGLGTLEKAIAALQMENSQLASTRDELLPLLMSGRVRVAEEVAA